MYLSHTGVLMIKVTISTDIRPARGLVKKTVVFYRSVGIYNNRFVFLWNIIINCMYAVNIPDVTTAAGEGQQNR